MRPLPVGPVTIELLVALHYTGNGKTDLVDIVITMDNYEWVTIPDSASEKEQPAALKRCRDKVGARIKGTLSKVTGASAKEKVSDVVPLAQEGQRTKGGDAGA